MRFAVTLLLLACVYPAIKAQKTNGDNSSTAFAFKEFNSTQNIHLVGVASLQSRALQLTNHSGHVIGRAYYPNPVQMKGNDDDVVSFNTTFVFAIVPHPRSGGGSGFCFVMTPDMSLHKAIDMQYLGLVNSTSNGKSYNHIFAVEFDTTMSVDIDIDDNHVAVDLNSIKSFAAATAGMWSRDTFRSINLKSGRNIQAWIEYDGGSTHLEVRIAPVGEPRPEKALLSNKTLNLAGILEKEMYVGFSSSTAYPPLVEDHYILAWSFTTGGSPSPPLNILSLPSFYVEIPKFYKSARFLAPVILSSLLLVVGVCVSAFYWLKRTGFIEFYDKWEVQYWPHRFPYRDLRLATNNFREENLLGAGGFGRVYHGVLPDGDEVAVKCINRDCADDGMKEFVAEISSLGRLQHRNLVPLRGWCRKNNRLFIVYDYMPNGSLDTKLHRCHVGLTWAQRYHILKGVAAGILYLHEQWEKRVVHRDIKASNVLLDSELDGRVGDFGLARLYDHSEKPQTTHVVGTLGYIAPELIQSGKASPCTDVFSFGALMLEVACATKPVDSTGVILVQRVWEMYVKGKIVDVVDPRLGGKYDVEEAEIVLKLGVLCCHSDAKERPSMRQVVQILSKEAALPLELEDTVCF